MNSSLFKVTHSSDIYWRGNKLGETQVITVMQEGESAQSLLDKHTAGYERLMKDGGLVATYSDNSRTYSNDTISVAFTVEPVQPLVVAPIYQ